MPREIPVSPTTPSNGCALCATRRSGERRAVPRRGPAHPGRGAGIGPLPSHRLFGQRGSSARRRDHRRRRGGGGDVIETSPDILSKMSGKDNPQAILGAYASPTPALPRSTGSLAAVAGRAGAARSGQYRHHPAHRRRDRRGRADPDRRQRRSLFGRSGAGVDGRDLHAKRRDRPWEEFLPWLRGGPGQLVGTSLNTDNDYLDAPTSSPASC